MGLITYLGNFILNLSATMEPLRELLQKDIAWHWNKKHEEETNKIKNTLIDKYHSDIVMSHSQ